MAVYNQVLTYTYRDSLSSGDPNKIIKGAYLDGEFSAIHSASLDAASLSGSNTFAGTTQTFNGALVVGAATGGAQGAGTINATAIYVNGAIVGSGSGSVTSVGVSSANAAISVTGSPITTTGTIALTANTFTTTNPGVVPASGGGTVNWLRADGTWDQLTFSAISGTIANAQVPVGAVTQWQTSLSIGWSQVTGTSNVYKGTLGSANITISTSGPSGGSNGDIWFQY